MARGVFTAIFALGTGIEPRKSPWSSQIRPETTTFLFGPMGVAERAGGPGEPRTAPIRALCCPQSPVFKPILPQGAAGTAPHPRPPACRNPCIQARSGPRPIKSLLGAGGTDNRFLHPSPGPWGRRGPLLKSRDQPRRCGRGQSAGARRSSRQRRPIRRPTFRRSSCAARLQRPPRKQRRS